MNCRKCGAKQITRRKAGVFVCQHCGIQPGPYNLDRAGYSKTDILVREQKFDTGDYIFAARKPRLCCLIQGVQP